MVVTETFVSVNVAWARFNRWRSREDSSAKQEQGLALEMDGVESLCEEGSAVPGDRSEGHGLNTVRETIDEKAGESWAFGVEKRFDELGHDTVLLCASC
jgi:hypothetical protein